MKPVKVYTTAFCPYCHAAMDLLRGKQIEFEEINLQNDPDALKALKERTGFRTVPQIFIGDEMIGGFQELKALEMSGELEKKLSA